MSLILDALNKSERERDNQNAVPDIGTVHSNHDPQPRVSANLVWIGILALVVLLFLTYWGVALLGGDRQDTSGGQPVAPAAVTPKPATEPEASAEKALPPQEVEASTPQPTQEVSALYEAPPSKPLVISEPPIKEAKVVEPSTTQQNSVDEDLAQRLWEETQRRLPPRPLPSTHNLVPEQKALAEDEVDAPFDETLAAFEGTPFLHELPPRIQDSIPSLMYALHQYHDGMVVINKKRYQQGNAVATGLVIERILADGLILNYEGNQFKLSALSSWVNY